MNTPARCRIPATWAGIKSTQELEKAGLACHIYMVYRYMVYDTGYPILPLTVRHSFCISSDHLRRAFIGPENKAVLVELQGSNSGEAFACAWYPARQQLW